MNKTKNYYFALALAAFGMGACNDGPNVQPEQPIPENLGVYVLNEGSINVGALGFYQFSTGNYNPTINDSNPILGGRGNHMIRYGSKLYVAAGGNSGSIQVFNARTGAGLGTVSVNDPRHVVAYGGRVYVSHGENHVSYLDTTAFALSAPLVVGNTPEQMTAFRNRLYVANSGASNNQISVINASAFSIDRNIDIPGAVNLNVIAGDSASNTLFVNASATYNGEDQLSESRLYTVNVSNGTINSNISFGVENIEVVYTINNSTGQQGQSIAFATSSNYSGVAGQQDYLYLSGLPNFNVLNTFFGNTSEITSPTSMTFLPEFGLIAIGDRKDGNTTGQVFLYSVSLSSGAMPFSRFDAGINPTAFAIKD